MINFLIKINNKSYFATVKNVNKKYKMPILINIELENIYFKMRTVNRLRFSIILEFLIFFLDSIQISILLTLRFSVIKMITVYEELEILIWKIISNID